jgi:hypothetical protein
MIRPIHLAATFVSVSMLTAVVLAQTQAPVTARGEWTTDARHGWSSDEGPRVQINLRSVDGSDNWGFGVPVGELEGLPPAVQSGSANDIRFLWRREAGTFNFQGSFDRGRGAGSYTFSADPAFVSGMATLGYRDLDATNLVRLAVVDVTQGYVRGLADAGYKGLPFDDLVRMRIHRVTPEMIRELGVLGYRGLLSDELVRMRIHGATPEFVRSMEAVGFKGLSADDLVRFRIHRVTPEFVQAMAKLG